MSNEQMIKVMSYLIGYRVGSQVMPQMLPGLQGDDVLAEMLGKGFRDGLEGNMDMSLIDEKVNEYQQTFLSMLQKRGDEKAQKNLETGRKYMEENGKREGVTTGSGESYDAAKHGDAPTAEVMYKGTLVDGTVFDQSQAPVKFNIRQVIPGFTEALKLMPVGSKWRVTIPADLAYGANGPGSIGPNSTLIFEMELLGLTK